MKQTAVEWLVSNMPNIGEYIPLGVTLEFQAKIEQAKAMEKEQLFLASNTSAKEAYKAGQSSMYCGCYEINGCTNYEEWLYNKTFKSE